MNKILDDIWSGKINPGENAVNFDEEYKKYSEILVKSENEFLNSINQEQKRLFDGFNNALVNVSML